MQMRRLRPKQPRLTLDPERHKALNIQVLDRDAWQCQDCGSMKNLQVHDLNPIGWRRYVQFDYALRELPRKMSQRAPGVTSARVRPGPIGDLNLVPTVVIRKAMLLILLASSCVMDHGFSRYFGGFVLDWFSI
jgi:hypothetical protein